MNVSELIGAKLDYWVARAEGLSPQLNMKGKYPNGREVFHNYVDAGTGCIYTPSSNWSQGGPIIEREELVWTWVNTLDGRVAMPGRMWELQHKSPLVAAMRFFVLRRFGEEVDDSQAHNVQGN